MQTDETRSSGAIGVARYMDGSPVQIGDMVTHAFGFDLGPGRVVHLFAPRRGAADHGQAAVRFGATLHTFGCYHLHRIEPDVSGEGDPGSLARPGDLGYCHCGEAIILRVRTASGYSRWEHRNTGYPSCRPSPLPSAPVGRVAHPAPPAPPHEGWRGAHWSKRP